MRLLPSAFSLCSMFTPVEVSKATGGCPRVGSSETVIIEIVTFKLKEGVTPGEFEPIDKAMQHQYVAKQPGFVARESAHGENGEWLAIVHWETAKDAEASMTTFVTAPAAQPFMSKVQAETMGMTRYTRCE
jgi:hypothetical protein